MALTSSRRGRAVVAVFAAILSIAGANAGPVSGTAELTDGSLGLVDITYADDGPAAVAIREYTKVPTRSTILGKVNVNGDNTGSFNLGTGGQSTHEHEATFSFSELVTNTTNIPQAISLDFLVSAGQLMTNAFEVPPGAGEFLQAGFEMVMRFAGDIVFESSAILRQIAGDAVTPTQTTLSTTGTSLDGILTLPILGSSTKTQFAWDDYLGNADLGLLAADTSGLFEYDVRTFVSAEFSSCGSVNCGNTLASIGDPFSIDQSGAQASSIGAPGSIVFTPATPGAPAGLANSVPEPGTLLLFFMGLFGLWASRRLII